MATVYVVSRIEGEYAYITEQNSGEELFIALALLPPSVDIGTRLLYEFPDFKIID
jgi:hypothetical protein